MKNQQLKKWIAASLVTEPPRAKSLVMTIFGDAIKPHSNAIWLSALIELMTPFGINDRLVRTSVFRLAEEGWLEAAREGRRSLYTLTEPGIRRVTHVYNRIYAAPDIAWDGSWTLIFATAGMLDAPERGAIRKELLWEGFSLICPGVFAHPSGQSAMLEEMMQRLDIAGQLFICRTRELDQVSTRPLRELIEENWPIPALVANYQQFIMQFSPLLKILKLKQEIEPEISFVIRTLLIHAFRRVQLHDPQLPLELLPSDWPGTAAYELSQQIYQLTYQTAEQHLCKVFGNSENSRAASDFYARFGGLS